MTEAVSSSSVNKEINDWEDLNVKTELLRGIYANGFEKPSPIQRQAILPIFAKRDVIAQAQSGTGKTATFVIGTLQNLESIPKFIKILVLAPTRELANQIQDVYSSIGCFMGINAQVCTGGSILSADIQGLKKNQPHISNRHSFFLL